MNTFPPPQPDLEPASSSSRKHLVLASAAATALAVTGLALGSQLADATNEAPDSTTEPAEEPDSDAAQDHDENTQNSGDDEETEDDDQAGDDFIDFDTGEYDELYDAFDTCMAEQLPDLLGGQPIDILGDEMFDEFDTDFGDEAGSVTIHQPGDGVNEFGDLSFLDFGEGDGSITISKTDGEISIATDGDVEQIDEIEFFDFDQLDGSEFEDGDLQISAEELAEFEKFEQQLEDASEACESTLPELDEDDLAEDD